MNKYKKPTLVSYKSQDIMEIVGPAHAGTNGIVILLKKRLDKEPSGDRMGVEG